MLLALDTSTRRPGVALYDGSQVVNEMCWISNFHHTMELAPAVELALRRGGIRPRQVECVAVALGPGSFTSLRSGLAFAKGMAMANQAALVGVPSLDILAAAQPVVDMPMLAVLEAGRKRLAVGRYRVVDGAWQRHKKLSLMTPQKLTQKIRKPTWICGELSEATRSLLKRKWKNARLASPAQSQRRPAFLAELAWARWQQGLVDEPAGLAPIYLSDNLQ